MRFKAAPEPPDFSVLESCPARVAYTDAVPTVVPKSAAWTDVAVMPPGTATDASAAADLRMTVDAAGGVDVLYANEDCNAFDNAGLSFTRSADGGATYPAAEHVTRPSFYRDNPDPDDNLPGKDTQVVISPSIASSPAAGSLHIVYPNFYDIATSGSDISYQRSTDLGATWSTSRTISLQPDGTSAANDQFLPWIAADPLTGFLHALWLDNRNDPANRLIEAFQAFSADDGATWTNAQISTAAWDPRFGAPDEPFAGNRSGLTAVGDRIYPMWGDARDPGPISQGHGGLDIFTNVEPAGSPARP